MSIRQTATIVCVVALATTGCTKQHDKTSTAVASPVLPAASAMGVNESSPLKSLQVTKSDWLAALKSTYTESNGKSDSEGITEFSACFGQRRADGKCPDSFMFGHKDAFRKLTTFRPPSSAMARFGVNKDGTNVYLHSYVSVIDCGKPNILLNPSYFSKGGWLFLEKTAVLADGDLVLEKTFDGSRVKRDNSTYGVQEDAQWIVSDSLSDLAALRKLPSAKRVIVRLTGSNGYATVPPEKIAGFKSDITAVLSVYDSINAAVENKQPTSCS